jgi:hypothetical protein
VLSGGLLGIRMLKKFPAKKIKGGRQPARPLCTFVLVRLSSWCSTAAVYVVRVFGLHGVFVAIDLERRRIEIRGLVGAKESDEFAFVADFRAEHDHLREVDPRRSVRIRDGLEGFVAQHVVLRIHQLAVRRIRVHRTAQDVLVRLDAVEHVPDVLEVNAAVIPAVKEC